MGFHDLAQVMDIVDICLLLLVSWFSYQNGESGALYRDNALLTVQKSSNIEIE